MPDPLLCDPSKKAELEASNGVDLIDYISYLVNNLSVSEIRESHVLEFHKLTVKDIYGCGGRYRDVTQNVVIAGSTHKVPAASRVPTLVHDLVERLNQDSGKLPGISCAAYALWRLNWIHPFAGGNGRTARALAYLVICIDMGQVPPGVPQMPTAIYDQRRTYVSALRTADEGERLTGEPNLGAMEALMEDAMTRQLAGAINQLLRPG